jgi:hypothetical protein
MTSSLPPSEEEAKVPTPVKRKFLVPRYLSAATVDQDPRLKSPAEKALILVVLGLAECSAGVAAATYFPAIPDMTRDLQASQVAVALTNSLFMLFAAFGPIVWGALAGY